MNSLRLCGGSAVTTATLATKRTFMWRSLRAAADDADRLLTGGWIAALARRSLREPASAASQGQVAGPRPGVGYVAQLRWQKPTDGSDTLAIAHIRWHRTAP